MRDHMMGWQGAVARVNELHPSAPTKLRLALVRFTPAEQEARRKLDTQNSRQEFAKNWWETMKPGERLAGSEKSLLNKNRLRGAFLAAKQDKLGEWYVEYTSPHGSNSWEFVEYLQPLSWVTRTGVEKAEKPITLLHNNVYVIETKEGVRYFRRYDSVVGWISGSRSYSSALRYSYAHRAEDQDITVIRLAKPTDEHPDD